MNCWGLHSAARHWSRWYCFHSFLLREKGSHLHGFREHTEESPKGSAGLVFLSPALPSAARDGEDWVRLTGGNVNVNVGTIVLISASSSHSIITFGARATALLLCFIKILKPWPTAQSCGLSPLLLWFPELECEALLTYRHLCGHTGFHAEAFTSPCNSHNSLPVSFSPL